jgi:arsenite-transporting ATPase
MEIGAKLTRVAPRLQALELNAEDDFEELRREYVEEVSAFFDQVGGRQVDVVYDRAVLEGLMAFAPPGIDEAMGLLRAMELLESADNTTVVVDTAPTGHFLRLLEMPELLQDWIRAIFRILQKYKTFIRLPRLADRLVKVSRQLRTFRMMLTNSDDAAIYVVGHLSTLSWDEVRSIADRCATNGLHMPAIVLNRVGHDHGPGPSVQDFRADFHNASVSSIAEGRPPQGVTDLRALGSSLFVRETA